MASVICRDAVGKFPDYPSEEDGGSLMIFKEKDPAEVEAALKALVSITHGCNKRLYNTFFIQVTFLRF